jgi:hypothetical protein
MVKTITGTCVLCHEHADVTDWAPVAQWVAVEHCRCGGFLVWTPLWMTRLVTLSDLERQELAVQVRAACARGVEVWLTTTDGKVTGPLILSHVCPITQQALASA